MKTKDGKHVQIIEDDNEPSEEILDKNGKRKPKKKKIMNENGEIEEVKEIIDDEEPSEIDEKTGKKKPKTRKYMNSKGDIYELEVPSKKKVKPKKIKNYRKR
jgi:CRISPR/Cas system-associated endonuclease Cas3-HD